MNSLKALWTLTKYSFLSKVRNPSTVFFGFIFPFIFILVFGLVGQGKTKYDIAFLNDSLTSTSTSSTDITKKIYDSIKNNDSLNIITGKTDDELKDMLTKGKIVGLISLDQQKLDSTRRIPITTVLNLQTTSADQSGGNIIKSILGGSVNDALTPKDNNGNPIQVTGPFKFNTSNVEGRKYETIDFILPGQLNFSLLSTGVFTLAFTIMILKQTLVIKRIFATPAPKWAILLSQMLSSLGVALMQSAVIILVGQWIFHFTLVNGIWTFLEMLVLASIGLIVFFGFGLFVSSIVQDENAIPTVANLITLPQFLLGGSFFSIDVFPSFLQPIAKAMPLTFLNDAMRAVAFEGASLIQVIPQIIPLLIWGVIIYLIVIRIFKWE